MHAQGPIATAGWIQEVVSRCANPLARTARRARSQAARPTAVLDQKRRDYHPDPVVHGVGLAQLAWFFMRAQARAGARRMCP
jgi:hypothetical protein